MGDGIISGDNITGAVMQFFFKQDFRDVGGGSILFTKDSTKKYNYYFILKRATFSLF
jgi:hypothetical protein